MWSTLVLNSYKESFSVSNCQLIHSKSELDYLRLCKPSPLTFDQIMGHHQHAQHSEDHNEPESSPKYSTGRSPSPISSGSRSASISSGDDHSGALSSQSSEGLGLEFSRKCAISADCLLLHPEIAGAIREEEEARELKKARGSVAHLKPPKTKMTASRSSDQINLTTGKEIRVSSEELERADSSSPGAKSDSLITRSPKSRSEPSTSSNPQTATSSSEKRKASFIRWGPGRLAQLLRRTRSAGSSSDVPVYALFLREKPVIKSSHHGESSSSGSTSEAHQERRRGRRQAPALQDIKQRLKFLRRSHTESSIESSSVKPTPEEVQKWSQSFMSLMTSRYGSSLFKAFLSLEFCQENIEFWLACEDFKRSRPSKFASKGKKIYEDFIAVQSPKEVNLDPTMRTNIQKSLSNPSVGTFDPAQRKIQGLLEADAYLRFLQSNLYKELLEPVKPESKPGTSKQSATASESKSGSSKLGSTAKTK